jgi:hypothetical protein
MQAHQVVTPERELSKRNYSVRTPKSQRGVIAAMGAMVLLVLIGFLGLALDLGQLYGRKSEMQSVADAIALAAAPELNGTPAGVTNAMARVTALVPLLRYRNYYGTVTWSDAAIKFGAAPAPDGDWRDVASTTALPAGLLYVKVDTSELGSDIGTINTIFMRVLNAALGTASTSAQAIAGPSAIKVTPLAVCAMSPNPAAQRVNPAVASPAPASPANVELVEFGFRRGVSYDLMQLNPDTDDDTAQRQNFLVNPIAPPGTAGSGADTTAEIASPFVCSGTMAMRRVTGGAITVARPFPLGSLFTQLNSRFDQYVAGGCDLYEAPPDANIRRYDFAILGNIPWMATPDGQRARKYNDTVNRKLWTIADPLSPGALAPATILPAMYGPLWSYAKAVPFSSYTPGQAEPAAGYTPFPASAWLTLYSPGRPSGGGYPAAIPYTASGGVNFEQPTQLSHRPGVRQRRVLNVPLLACPVSGSSATVLGIGKFFMTVPATANNIFAEFAGLASEAALGTRVELYQ